MDIIATSLSSNRVAFAIEECSIVVKSIPQQSAFDSCRFDILNSEGKMIMMEHRNKRKDATITPELFNSKQLGNLEDGSYYLCMYIFEDGTTTEYTSVIGPCDIQFTKKGNKLEFIKPVCCDHNKTLLDTLDYNDPRLLAPSNKIQSHNTNITNLAKQLKQNAIEKRTSIIAEVNRWVAKNVSYDKDSLNDDFYIKLNHSALSTLQKGRSVCQGYTMLTVAFLRALNIPALGMLCCATPTVEDKLRSKKSKSSNHIFPIAWFDNRWVLMDTTWNSHHVYDNRDYSFGRRDLTKVYPFKYFDSTLEFFSSTHEFTQAYLSFE